MSVDQCSKCGGYGRIEMMPGFCLDIDGQWWHDSTAEYECVYCKVCPRCGGRGEVAVIDDLAADY